MTNNPIEGKKKADIAWTIQRVGEILKRAKDEGIDPVTLGEVLMMSGVGLQGDGTLPLSTGQDNEKRQRTS